MVRMARDPVRRRKLSDEVEQRLLDIIQTQGLKPGDLLPSERELMAAYSVGRPTIREAMQKLERLGLVDIRHGERPRVAEPSMGPMIDQMALSVRHLLSHSQTSLHHLKEARLVFEMEMARIAARRRTKRDLAQLQDILNQQAASRYDARSFLEFDGRFHKTVAQISGNPIFESLSYAIFGWLADFHHDVVRSPGLESLTLSEHGALLAAIEAGDEEGAAQCMADHLTRANALYRVENLHDAQAADPAS